MDADTNAIAEARALYERWSKARSASEAERERHARAAEGYGQMIDGLVKIHPEVLAAPVHRSDFLIHESDGSSVRLDVKTHSRQGRGNPAIDNVVRAVSELGGWVVAKDVVWALKANDQLPVADDPLAAVRVSLRRAWVAGRLERSGLDQRTNRYRALPTENAETPALTGVSDEPTSSRAGGEISHAQPEADRDHDHTDRSFYRDHHQGAPVGASN